MDQQDLTRDRTETSINNDFQDGGSSRRKFLKTAPAAGAIGASLLSGCIGSIADSGSDSILIGATIPMSGAYGVVGEKIQDGLELAVQHANEQNDAGDAEVEIQFADTQTDPTTGRQRAREFIDDGADLIGGAISDATAKAVASLCQTEELINLSIGGSAEATGPACQPSHFIISGSTYQHSHGAPKYVLEQGLGESVYTITADYLWGQSNREVQENVLAPRYNVDYIGNSFTQLGKQDYSQSLIEARDSGADIIILNHFGGDHINSANQAKEFGLYEDAVLVWPFTGLIEGQAIPAEIRNHENFYAGVWYWPTLGTGENSTQDSKDFVNAYRSAYEELPTAVAAMNYAAFRTALEVMGDLNITDGSGENAQEIRKGLEGKELSQQLWGTGEFFREGNHSMVFPQMTVQGNPDAEGNIDMYQLINIPNNPLESQNREIDETGCTLPSNWSN